MRLFQRHLTAKVSNIGGCSKTLKTDKDVSYKSWLDFKQLAYSEDASEATVRAQVLTSPKNKPLSNINRTTSKEYRQTSKECRLLIKQK